VGLSRLCQNLDHGERELAAFQQNSPQPSLNMKMPLYKLLPLTAFFGMTAVSQSATINWSLATDISGESDVSLTGTLDRAYNVTNATGGNVSINGVPFLAFNVTTATTSPVTVDGTTLSTSETFTSTLGAGSSSDPFVSLSAPYRTMLGQSVYVNGSTGTMTLTLDGLTAGYTYLFQVWANVSNNVNLRHTTVTAGNVVDLDANTTNAIGGLGQFAIGTFTADAASQLVAFSGQSPPLSGFQLRVTAVPESSMWSLLGFGLFGVAMLRRRRA